MRCPTFSWAGVAGAQGYELAVFRLGEDADAEPELVSRVEVPGEARSWTPAVGECLERGSHYAWSVAAVGADRAVERSGRVTVRRDETGDIDRSAATRLAGALDAQSGSAGTAELDWAPALLFEVEAAPSDDEVESARETLERYLENRGERALDTPSYRRLGDRPHVAVPAPAAGGGKVKVTSAGTTPALGTPSLHVGANISLSAASNVFKDDKVFVWDDTAANTALGREALASLTLLAHSNTAVGQGALQSTYGDATLPDVGSYNTALGARALDANGGGSLNTATGWGALRHNTFARENTASGAAALYSNTTGFSNTASGSHALRHNTSGSNNTASGAHALFSNTTGSQNTASGTFALRFNTTGSSNTASGYEALRHNTLGSRNSASGYRALRSNTSGAYNTASGSEALRLNTTGSFNTASGSGALRRNTTGYHNTADGLNALYYNTTGFLNAASGSGALQGNTTGNQNTASGSRALQSNTTGSRNTALGYRAGGNNTTNSDSIFIANVGSAADSATIKIGTQGTQGSTFIAGIFDVDTGVDAIPVLVSSDGQLGTVSSSRALKRDIQDLGALSERLLELRPVAFRFRQHVEANADTPLEFGLIAEEVAEVFPELVVFDAEGKPQTVKYHLLSALLLGELQEQHEAVEKQREELEDQRTELGVQRAEVEQHRADLERQRAEYRAQLEAITARLGAIESRSRSGGREDSVGGRN